MIHELELLKKYDLKELEKYKHTLGDSARCLINIIKVLSILDNRTEDNNNELVKTYIEPYLKGGER